jgi:hypothetical protein
MTPALPPGDRHAMNANQRGKSRLVKAEFLSEYKYIKGFHLHHLLLGRNNIGKCYKKNRVKPKKVVDKGILI